jgi:DNA primase
VAFRWSLRKRGVGFVENFPAIGAAVALPYTDEIAKFRAIEPKEKHLKFRHLPNHPSANRLYGIKELDRLPVLGDVYVVESDLDSLTMAAQGFVAVSVSSATTCLENGDLKILPEHIEKLKQAERVFLAFDMDTAGQKCAAAFEKVLPRCKTFRLECPYG